MSLLNDLLDISSVRHEIDKRESAGQWVAGKGGAGGSFPMRSEEERARRTDADSDAEVGNRVHALYSLHFTSHFHFQC